jgi:hypothetical protein
MIIHTLRERFLKDILFRGVISGVYIGLWVTFLLRKNLMIDFSPIKMLFWIVSY